MSDDKKKNNVEVEFTPEQQRFQTHIQSLSRKINQHQFEIDELMPSLKTYEQALKESMNSQADNITEDK